MVKGLHPIEYNQPNHSSKSFGNALENSGIKKQSRVEYLYNTLFQYHSCSQKDRSASFFMFSKIHRWLQFNFRYLGRPPWDTGISPPELCAFLASAKPGWALDLGCGTGTNLLTMLEHGWSVSGVDIAWLSVLRARRKLHKAGYRDRVMQGNVSGNVLQNLRFDFVLDIGSYHSLNEVERGNYQNNLQRWLNPGGTYLLYAHRKNAPTDTHGITEKDLSDFSTFLAMHWREDDAEKRPDGRGGRPATWVRYDRLDQVMDDTPD